MESGPASEQIKGGIQRLAAVEAGVGLVGGIVDGDHQHAAFAAILEPVVLAAVHLQQFPEARPPRTTRSVLAAAAAGLPQSRLLEQRRERVGAEVLIVVRQLLAGEGGAKANIAAGAQFHDRGAFGIAQAVIGPFAAGAVDQAAIAIAGVSLPQPAHLPH